MHEITHQSARDYLRITGRVAANEPVEARELAGGVSNAVLLVTLPASGEQFVLKQARHRLRVKEEWLCPVERIWREVEVLRVCGELLKAPAAEHASRDDAVLAIVPEVLWEDRENFVYAMTAAPKTHRTWKQLLLDGDMFTSHSLAIVCGRLLGQLHARSWANAEIASRLDDRSYFDQLRLDPYYRHIARVHPELGPAIERLTDSVGKHRRCLVHGDFSPKNLLVWPGHMMLIDFEVGHWGDPAFDLGFFLTHLVLKSIWADNARGEYLGIATEFWRTYRTTVASLVETEELRSLEARMIFNLAGCLLARVEGKSPVEYLSIVQQEHVRRLASDWIVYPPPTFDEALVSSTKC